jgi:hypothetical protein
MMRRYRRKGEAFPQSSKQRRPTAGDEALLLVET